MIGYTGSLAKNGFKFVLNSKEPFNEYDKEDPGTAIVINYSNNAILGGAALTTNFRYEENYI